MKRVSVAEAKNQLPALLHEAEAAPVEIVRRGKPVAVLVSSATYERMNGGGAGMWAKLESFRASHDLDALDLGDVFDGVRDRSPGRAVRW